MSSVKPERAALAPVIDDPVQTAPAPVETADPSEVGNIDKIREIIFGGQMRDYEKRFIRLETRLIKESADLRDETRRRFDVLEMFIKREIDALAERLQIEQRHREESAQAASRALGETAQALESKLAQFDEASARAQRELRQDLLQQSKTLSEEIQLKHAEISTLVEQEVANLQTDKPSRNHLASMFTELATRLNGELKVPTET